MPSEPVPAHANIEITLHAYERARERLGLDEDAVRSAIERAKRVDMYKDGLRLWRISGGWLAVHEMQLAGGEQFRAVVVTALDDAQTLGWRPRSPAAYTAPKRRARVAVNHSGRRAVAAP
jgi:hypothetical protein